MVKDMQAQWNRNVCHTGKTPFNILKNLNFIDILTPIIPPLVPHKRNSWEKCFSKTTNKQSQTNDRSKQIQSTEQKAKFTFFFAILHSIWLGIIFTINQDSDCKYYSVTCKRFVQYADELLWLLYQYTIHKIYFRKTNYSQSNVIAL